MEKKKNNATEKVENIANDNAVITPADELKMEVEMAQANQKANTNLEIAEEMNNKAKVRLKRERLTEEEKAQRRIDRARLLDEKKKERNIRLEAKKTAALAREEELKAERLRRKEERIKRRDLLKSETKVERMERIMREKELKREEKAEKRAIEQQKREEKANYRHEKLHAKKALKEQKRRLKMENRKDRRSRGIGGWLAAVISLGCAVLVLSTLFTFSLIGNFGGDNMFENTIEKSFYDLVSYVDNMDVNLSKLMVSNDEREQQRLLSEINVQANLASNNVGELPLQDESRFYTAKYINQLGDYAKYLNNKLIDGGAIAESDWNNLNELYTINNTLKNELSQVSARLGEDYKFTSLMKDEKNNAVLSSFVELEKGAVDYPKMIYDGPFSDSKETPKPKAIVGPEISAKDAIDVFKSTFSAYEFDNVEVVSEVSGKILCYGVEGKAGDMDVYAEISVNGGKVVMFNCYSDCSAKKVSIDECKVIAEKQLERLGIEGMKAVWATETSGTCYLNFCYDQDGVVIYPDMIKLTVCEERGVVSAFDATEYYLNHTKRTIGKATITKEQALKNLSTNVDVETVRLTVVPKGQSKEALAYEISGTFAGATYYLYIDAKTGHEIQIFRVIETTEGTLLM